MFGLDLPRPAPAPVSEEARKAFLKYFDATPDQATRFLGWAFGCRVVHRADGTTAYNFDYVEDLAWDVVMQNNKLYTIVEESYLYLKPERDKVAKRLERFKTARLSQKVYSDVRKRFTADIAFVRKYAPEEAHAA